MQELWEYIEANYNEENFNIFDAKSKSLDLEKQQIIESYCYGCKDISNNGNIFPRETAEEYYNKTYD